MAIGLKIGNKVTVKKDYKFPQDTPEAQKGIKRLKVGDVAVVVGAGVGKSVIVEFKKKQGQISSQRLELVQETQPLDNEPDGMGTEEPASIALEPTTVTASNHEPATSGTDVGSNLINLMANKLLLSGGIRRDTEATVEIRLSELPPEIETQLRALVEAKLSLGVHALLPTKTEQPKKDKVVSVKRSPGRPRKS